MMELNRPQWSVPAGAPLPRRTGHEDFPHPALAWVVSSRKHSQAYQSQMVQMRIQANSPAGPPTPLTAPTQMLAQPIPHEVVQVAKRVPRVAQLKVVGPAPHLPIHPPDQLRQGRVALMVIDQPAPKPHAIAGVDRAGESASAGLGQLLWPGLSAGVVSPPEPLRAVSVGEASAPTQPTGLACP